MGTAEKENKPVVLYWHVWNDKKLSVRFGGYFDEKMSLYPK